MGKLCRQSLKHDRIQFWKLGLALVGTIIIMNLVMGWAVRFGPVIGSMAAIGVLIISAALCFRFIYRYLSKYDYRLIGKELILERAFGRANHVVFTVDVDQIEGLKPYHDFEGHSRIKRLHKFVLHRDTDKWYVVSFKQESDMIHLVFEPDEKFLSGLTDSLPRAV